MSDWQRRSFLSSGSALVAGGLIGSVGTAAETNGEQPAPVAEQPGWSSYRGNAGNSASVETDEFPEPDDLAWEYEESGELAAVNGTVYLRTDDGEIHALDAQDGALEWKRTALTLTEVPFDPQGTPAVADGTVFVTGNQLTALDAATGEVEWRVTFNGVESMASPTVAYGTVYVVAAGTLYAIDATDGSIAWERDTVSIETVRPADVVGGRKEVTEERAFRSATVAVANETIYACTEAAPNEALDDDSEFAALVALDALTGDARWDRDFEQQTTAVGTWSPAVAGELVYVGSGLAGIDNDLRGGSDLETGEADSAWSREPIASTDAFRATTGEYSLRVRDLEREEPVWNEQYWSSAPNPFTDKLIVGETLIVLHTIPEDAPFDTYSRDSILGLDIEDGTEKWSVPVDDLDGVETLLADETTLYIATNEGLVALRSSQANTVDEDDGESDDESTDGNETENREGDDDETADAEHGDDESEDSNESDTETTTDDDGSDDEGAAGDDPDPDDEASRDEMEEAAGGDGTGTDGEDEPGALSEGEETDDQGTDESEGDADVTADSIPGFTTGAGLAGGALSLEWLRRRTADEPDE